MREFNSKWGRFRYMLVNRSRDASRKKYESRFTATETYGDDVASIVELRLLIDYNSKENVRL